MAEIRVTALAPRMPSTRLVTTLPMVCSASRTRTLVTGESVSDRLDDISVAGGARMGFGQCSDMGMRRALEGVRREHQHEVDAEALPVDGAQIADGGRDVPAEYV